MHRVRSFLLLCRCTLARGQLESDFVCHDLGRWWRLGIPFSKDNSRRAASIGLRGNHLCIRFRFLQKHSDFAALANVPEICLTINIEFKRKLVSLEERTRAADPCWRVLGKPCQIDFRRLREGHDQLVASNAKRVRDLTRKIKLEPGGLFTLGGTHQKLALRGRDFRRRHRRRIPAKCRRKKIESVSIGKICRLHTDRTLERHPEPPSIPVPSDQRRVGLQYLRKWRNVDVKGSVKCDDQNTIDNSRRTLNLIGPVEDNTGKATLNAGLHLHVFARCFLCPYCHARQEHEEKQRKEPRASDHRQQIP